MKDTIEKLSDFSKGPVHEWGMYVNTSRAIPSMMDGMKPSQRFYLYSSIVNSPKEFKKVSAVGGVGSDYGFNHGEDSLMKAGQLMAATWANNICLVEGKGSFGTRLVQNAAAPRYTFTRLHRNFYKYMKDFDLVPDHKDPDHKPPQYYLPVIPLVLMNGVRGIATGFATTILPRSEKDMILKMREYLKTGKVKGKIQVEFPKFSGTVLEMENDKFSCQGTWEKVGKTKMKITEVPYGFDRESYVKVLDDLEDKGEIVSYIEKCDKEGFNFEVTLKRDESVKWSDAKILSKFKLEKSYSENITVIGPDDDLRVYSNAEDLMVDFCNLRLKVLEERIALCIKNIDTDLDWLKKKQKFVELVIAGDIGFRNRKKDEIIEQIKDLIAGCTVEEAKKLLTIQIVTLTQEEVDKIKAAILELEKELEYYNQTTPNKEFLNDLKDLEKAT